MIEISNEELAKVLNLWTGTEDWTIQRDKLFCVGWVQRDVDGKVYDPEDYTKDKEAHALVNFMLKERKYLNRGGKVFHNSAEGYVAWVRVWEKRFENMSQEELCIPPSEQDVDHCEASEQLVVDHSIPVRYDHLISTEELVKRAKERWPDDGWIIDKGRPVGDGWYLTGSDGKELQPSLNWGPDFAQQRLNLITLIDEARSEKTTPEIIAELEECRNELCEPSLTKAERFYAFLATPQPDISPGLWGIAAMVIAPVRGGDAGWAREDVGGLIEIGGWTEGDSLGDVCETKLCV